MDAKKVFLSYSHDSDAHREKVLALSERLRADGVETFLDQYVNGSPAQGWPRWMLDQLDAADAVLVVCTETYYRRFRGHDVPGKGKGADWEGALITQETYDRRCRNLKFVPVLLAADGEEFIPEPLRSLTHYQLVSESAYQALYDFLLGQAGVEPGAVGSSKPKPRSKGSPLTFGAEPPRTVAADLSRILKYAPAELIGREAELKLLNDAWHGGAELPLRRDDPAAESRRPSKPKVLTFVALGGEGKTSLVAKWAADLAHQDWPGCDAVFAWSFYSQGTREQLASSSDLFLKEALTFFGDDADKEFAASPAGAFEKGQRLARVVGQRRSLLILDGLEPLQYAPTAPTPGQLKDQGIAALLKGLATASHGLCVVTTRYSLPDLKAFWQTTAPEVNLLRLSRDAGMHLLKTLGVRGTAQELATLVEDLKGHALTLNLLGSYLHNAHAGDIRKRDLVKLEEADAESDHPHRAFHVLDAYVRWLETGGAPVSDPARNRGSPHAGPEAGAPNAMGQRALAILRLLGLFDRPATAECLDALWKGDVIMGLTEPLAGLGEAQRNLALKRLEEAKLLTVNRDASGALVSLDAHPHIREYFAKQLRAPAALEAPTGRNRPAQGNALGSGIKNSGSPEGAIHGADVPPLQGSGVSGASVPGALPQAVTSRPVGAQSFDAWRAAHRRLYEHLCATTNEGDQPTLEDLQPLYQAVAHGCQAGLQQEACDKVYIGRILRGMGSDGFYTTKKLGAFGPDLGAIACFFEQPWNRISTRLTEPAQAWVFGVAPWVLRALGRLLESLEPMRASLQMAVGQEDWENAAILAGNLSELELTLGEVAKAVGDAEQSVTYAGRSGDAFQRMSKRCPHADALHQAGRRAEAETRFREAEQMQAKDQPVTPLLYSLRGFKYCDLLLAAPEHAAWQALLGGAELPLRPTGEIEQCRAVSQRATQTLMWAEQNRVSLLDLAINHLTLGRAALYKAILESGATLPLGPTGEAGLAPAAEHRRPTGDEWETARRELDVAVSGLRRAGTQDHIPRGLLTRAWLQFLDGKLTGPGSAQEDLDEAWEIAERGPMRLFLADIHLYRARLFGRRSSEGGVRNEAAGYPWNQNPDGSPRGPKDDLAAAETLINSCGYHRRDEELADAKRALLGA